MHPDPTATFEHALSMPPVDTRYVAGRWHHDRVTLQGYKVEARVLLKSLIVARNRPRKFLIIGRARSGTTLLTKMLNAHSQIHCDLEVLKSRVMMPHLFLNNLAAKSRAQVYGAKFLSYQMVQIYRMRDPRPFLRALAADGFTLIHLHRGSFEQTLSLAVAQKRAHFHSDTGTQAPSGRIRLDPDNFSARIAWAEALLAYERAALAEIDHLEICYERDLATPESQIATVERLCGQLGVAPEKFEIPLKKILPSDPERILENYDEIRARLIADGHGPLLPCPDDAQPPAPPATERGFQ